MYRRDEVIQALFGRVGFRQPTQADYAGIVDAANSQSKSKRYFDGFHAIVTVPNLLDIVNNDPTISAANFNQFLKELQEDCICAVLDGIFNQPEIIEERLEFDRCDDRPVLIPNTGLFVGRIIKVASDPNKAVNVNAIALSFNGAATFNLYLFNSVKKAPIKTQEVTTEADSQVIVNPDSWVLHYLSSGNKSGIYYIGYFQDDLGTAQAYDERPWQWNAGNIYLSEGIEVKRVPTQNPYRSNRTYGLNIEYSSVKDYTEVILRNPAAFDKAIGLQMAAMVVERIIHSTRSNITERIGQEGAARLYNDLNIAMATDEMPYSSGLKNQLDRELKRLNKNFFKKKHVQTVEIPYETCCIPKFPRWG